MKVCTKCKSEKDESEFHKHKLCKNGINSVCILCAKIQREKFKVLNPDIVKKWKKQDYERHKDNYRTLSKKHSKSESYKRYRVELKKARIVTLYSPYVHEKLKQRGFTTQQIKDHPELIDILKIIIKTKRAIKNLQYDNNN